MSAKVVRTKLRATTALDVYQLVRAGFTGGDDVAILPAPLLEEVVRALTVCRDEAGMRDRGGVWHQELAGIVSRLRNTGSAPAQPPPQESDEKKKSPWTCGHCEDRGQIPDWSGIWGPCPRCKP